MNFPPASSPPGARVEPKYCELCRRMFFRAVVVPEWRMRSGLCAQCEERTESVTANESAVHMQRERQTLNRYQ